MCVREIIDIFQNCPLALIIIFRSECLFGIVSSFYPIATRSCFWSSFLLCCCWSRLFPWTFFPVGKWILFFPGLWIHRHGGTFRKVKVNPELWLDHSFEFFFDGWGSLFWRPLTKWMNGLQVASNAILYKAAEGVSKSHGTPVSQCHYSYLGFVLFGDEADAHGTSIPQYGCRPGLTSHAEPLLTINPDSCPCVAKLECAPWIEFNQGHFLGELCKVPLKAKESVWQVKHSHCCCPDCYTKSPPADVWIFLPLFNRKNSLQHVR